MKTPVCALLFAAAFFAAASKGISHERHAPRAEIEVANYVPSTTVSPTWQRLHVISNDLGGDIVTYAQRVARVRSEPSTVIFTGNCASACTLFLSLPTTRTCIMPGASFIFHRAYGASPDMNEWGTDYMMRQYPEWVQTWIDQRGGLHRDLIRMDFAYASRFMPVCRVGST